MNVIVFTTWVVFEFIPAVHTEIIESHLSKGDTVKVVVCDSQLHSCFYPNLALRATGSPLLKNKDTCITCQLKWRSILIDDLKVNKENIVPLTPVPNDFIVPHFESKKELQNCKYKGIDIGVGIMSSLTSLTQDVDVDIIKNRKEVEGFYKNAVTSILTMEQLTESFKTDKVYIFNGRLSERRAVVEFCENKNINYDTWEIAQSLKHYYLVNRTIPHDPLIFGQDAITLFEESNLPKEEIIKQAEDWYKLRRYGEYEERPNDINYKKLMTDQDITKLNINPQKTNIAIFISSEHEIASLGQKIWPIKYRQEETIRRIINHFEGDQTIHFYLRIHPNLRNVDNIEKDKLNKLSSSVLTIIPAESEIDSYSLLEACDKTVCFGSTIGIEATYWKKPSILFGTSAYKYIPNSVYSPETIEELFSLIKNPNLTYKDKEAAYIYSYSIQNKGKHIKREDIYDRPVTNIYSKYKLLYPIYTFYKKTDFLAKVVKKLELEKITKKVLVYISK